MKPEENRVARIKELLSLFKQKQELVDSKKRRSELPNGGSEKGIQYVLKNQNAIGTEELISSAHKQINDRKAGFTSFFMMGFMTLFFETLFILLTYFLVK